MNAIGIGDTAGFPFDRHGPAASSPWETAPFFSGTPPLATAMGGPLRKAVTGWGRRVSQEGRLWQGQRWAMEMCLKLGVA